MLVVISPAKKLDWSDRASAATTPDFQDDAQALAQVARGLPIDKLKALMHLSDDLANLNAKRFQDFAAAPCPSLTRPAVFAFAGDTYQGLEAASLDPEELTWAQDHLRILSGLYGVLRPLDAIQPYRLEMGSRLQNPRGKTLYDFWGDRISNQLNADAARTQSAVLINCASQEYFGAVRPGALALRVITPQFLEDKGDGKPAKVISFYAKKARGAMARFVVQRRLRDPEALQDFDGGGYVYQRDRSTPDQPVFLRRHSAA